MIDFLHGFLSTPAGYVIAGGASVLGFVFYILEKTVGLTWRFHRWRRSRRYRRDLFRPSPDTVRRVVGREGDLAALRKILQGTGTGSISPMAVITGGAGIGKSTLARYFSEMGASYDRRELIPAASHSGLVNALAALGDRLLGEAPGIPPQTRARNALDAITDRGRSEHWLLIYDNAENPSAINDWLADGRNLHVLITTRCPDWPGTRFETHALGVLSEPHAVELLEEESGRKGEGFKELAKEVGFLPLALVQAGDWLAAHPGTSVSQYLKRLDKLLDDWPLEPGEVRDYPLPAGTAVRLSIRSLSPDARALLGVMAWFDPDHIARQVFEEFGAVPFWRWWRGYGRAATGWTLRSICTNPLRLETALRELRRTGLIEDATPSPDLTGATFTIHRIVQRATRKELGRRAKALRAIALLAAVYPNGSKPFFSQYYPLCERLTPHVLALRASGSAPNVEAWDYLLNQAGIFLSAMADYPGRLPLAQECLRVMRARGLPESDRAVANAYANLGMAHRRLRQWDLAEANLAKALTLDEAHRRATAPHSNHLDMMGGLMLDLALDGQLERLDRAIRLRQQALAIRRNLAGRRSEDVAEMLNNLGMARDFQGRGGAAARLYMAALSIRRTLLAPHDARLGLTAMKLGALWLASGEVEKAEPLLREALEIREAVFATQPQHPDRQQAAGLLISCLLLQASTGANRGAREGEAKRLCEQYAFDYVQRVKLARQHPSLPA